MGGTPEEEPGNQGPAVGGQQLLLAAIVCFRSPSFFLFCFEWLAVVRRKDQRDTRECCVLVVAMMVQTNVLQSNVHTLA